MNPIKGFYVATAQLITFLEDGLEQDRDKRIAEINRILDERQVFLDQVKQPLTEGEKELAKKAMELNKKLQTLLEQEKAGIQQDMSQLKTRKITNRQYINPYTSLQNVDGSFIDKRK